MVHEAEVPSPISQALVADLTNEESVAIARIEKVRKRTEADRREIMILDHGAGSATEKRTAVEMETGVAKIQIVGDVCTIASKPPAWGEMLFKLVRYSRSTNCIEMGTCLGISAAYISARPSS